MSADFYKVMVGDFGPIITLIVIIMCSLAVIFRLGVKFDLNKHLYSRKNDMLFSHE